MKRLLTLIFALVLFGLSHAQPSIMTITMHYSNPSNCYISINGFYKTASGKIGSIKIMPNTPTPNNQSTWWMPYDTTTIITSLTTGVMFPIQQLCTCGMLASYNTYINVYHTSDIFVPWCWDGGCAPNLWYMLNGTVATPCNFSLPYPYLPTLPNCSDMQIDTVKIPNGYHGQMFETVDSINNINYIGEVIKPSKKVIKVMDELGREAIPEPNKTLIYLYSDGTLERKIIIKE